MTFKYWNHISPQIQPQKEFLLSLLSVSIFDDIEDLIDSNGVDWLKVLELSSNQGVKGLVWSLIEERETINSLIPIDDKMQWIGTALMFERDATIFVDKCKSVLIALKKEGFNIFVLKGLDYARFWPNPLLREFGDLDIISSSCYQKINDRFNKIGASVNENYYKHSTIIYDGLTIENHRCLTSYLGSSKGRELEDLILRLLNSNIIDSSDDPYLSPNATFTAIFFIIHCHRHFFTDRIILRQLLDWCYLIKAKNELIDWAVFNRVIRDYNYSSFVNLLTSFCIYRLNMPREIIKYEFNESTKKDVIMFELDMFDTCETTSNSSNVFTFFDYWFFRIKRIWRFRKWLQMSFIGYLWSIVASRWQGDRGLKRGDGFSL